MHVYYIDGKVGNLLLMPVVYTEFLFCETHYRPLLGHWLYDTSTVLLTFCFSAAVWREIPAVASSERERERETVRERERGTVSARERGRERGRERETERERKRETERERLRERD